MTDTRYDQMREQVQRFHDEHPEVWDLFVRFTRDRMNRGFKNYAVKAIFERIRWEVDGVGGNDRASFKLNNNYRSRYARLMAQTYPRFEGFFETRNLRSA